jgi:rhodanese-related sulfurtransferase
MSKYDLQSAQDYFQAKLAYTTGVHELEVLVEQRDRGQAGMGDFAVLDVRFPRDFAQGHVPAAINLPKGKWQNPRGLRKDVIHYVYCYDQTCHMAAEAAAELTRQDYKAIEVEGGWDRWLAKGYRSESSLQAA